MFRPQDRKRFFFQYEKKWRTLTVLERETLLHGSSIVVIFLTQQTPSWTTIKKNIPRTWQQELHQQIPLNLPPPKEMPKFIYDPESKSFKHGVFSGLFEEISSITQTCNFSFLLFLGFRAKQTWRRTLHCKMFSKGSSLSVVE